MTPIKNALRDINVNGERWRSIGYAISGACHRAGAAIPLTPDIIDIW
jgi:hypothetical protein